MFINQKMQKNVFINKKTLKTSTTKDIILVMALRHLPRKILLS